MKCTKNVQIGGIVVLYEPQSRDFDYLKTYVNKVGLLLILDNSKMDNNDLVQQYLGNIDGQFEYVHFGENIGLCAALNRGIKLLESKGYTWAIVMDSDSSWKSDVYSVYMTEIQKDESVAVYAPVQIHDRSNEIEYEGIKEVDWAMTSGCCFNIVLFSTLGGFNERLFVDGLDIDYCFRVRENGLRIVQCGKALINHNPAETHCFELFGAKILKYGKASPWRYYMQIRSLTWLILRFHRLELVKIWLWKWFKVIFFFDKKKSYIQEMCKGISDGISIWKDYRTNCNKKPSNIGMKPTMKNQVPIDKT